MQPAQQVSTDGKSWWDGQSWQALRTGDSPELDVAHGAGSNRGARIIGAVALWSVLVVGIGIVAIGSIALADLLSPHHTKDLTVASVVILIGLGGLVSLSAALQWGGSSRAATSSSVDRSSKRWMLWSAVVLGIGIAVLGMIVLLDLLSPHHAESLTAGPGIFLIGLGGLVILGPALRLLGFGLSISEPVETQGPAKLTQSQYDSAWRKLAIGVGVVGFFAGVVGTTRQGGIGWGLVAGLVMAVTFGVPLGIARVMQRGNKAQGPTQAAPPSLATDARGAVTLWPTRSIRWVGPLLGLALAAGALWLAVQSLIQGTPPDAAPWWFGLVFAVPLIGLAILTNRSLYIRVDDSTIVFGPNWLGRRTFDRRELARITGSLSRRFSTSVWFLRTDGSTLYRTSGSVWGRAGLQSLANYLGVPLEGAIPSYWDFGRWS